MHNPESILENEIHKILWDFDLQIDHLIVARRPKLVIVNKKQRTCRIVDFAIPADLWVKLKEDTKIDKYLDLARELEKLWNMKLMRIPTVISVFDTVTKGLRWLEEMEHKWRPSKWQHC